MSVIKLYINTPKTKKDEIIIIVNTNETISQAKEKYYTKAKSRVNNQWLYDGAVLKDSDTISSKGLENLDIIEAHPSARGGNIILK